MSQQDLGIILLTLLFAAAVFDMGDYRVPNWLAGSGIITGLYFSGSWKEAGIKCIAVAVVFFISMLRAMGAADAKLWMAAACLSGPAASCVMVLAACGILFAAGCRKEGVVRTAGLSALGVRQVLYTGKVTLAEDQEKYPFALYLFLGCCITSAGMAIIAG